MSEPNVPPDAAQQPGAVDETMPDPAAAAGESAPDSQADQPAADTAAAAAALEAELREAPRSPDLRGGTDISVELAPQQPPTTAPPASSDPDQMVDDPTDLGGVGGEGGAG